MKTQIKAEVVTDSLSPQGERLTSLLVTFPNIILEEVNTHRMLSKNTSLKDIPFKKMVESIQNDPFIPIAWQENHKGTQGNEYFTESYEIENRRHAWIAASKEAIKHAKWLDNLNTSEQPCNKLLEPFMWTTMLITGTEFEDFFEINCPKYQTPVSQTVEPQYSWKDLMEVHSNPDNLDLLEKNKDNYAFKFQHSKSSIEIHIQALAEKIYDAMNESTPKQLKAGEWHIPFGDQFDQLGIVNIIKRINNLEYSDIGSKEVEEARIKIATARCARLSYMTFDRKIDYAKDLKLHDQLLKDKHFSPFEHCARVMTGPEYYSFVKGKSVSEQRLRNRFTNRHYGWCNNFKGFIQHRYLIENAVNACI